MAQTRPKVEEVGNLYTYTKPILVSDLDPGLQAEANMYKRFMDIVSKNGDGGIGVQIREKGERMRYVFYGETVVGNNPIVLPRRLIQGHFSQNETSQSKDSSGGGKKTRRRRRKTKRRKYKKRYSIKYRK